jgi:hypothetical protein
MKIFGGVCRLIIVSANYRSKGMSTLRDPVGETTASVDKSIDVYGDSVWGLINVGRQADDRGVGRGDVRFCCCGGSRRVMSWPWKVPADSERREDCRRLIFLGTGGSLWGQYIKWWFFCLITLGIYSFWVMPRMTRWIVENTDFDPAPAF